MKKKTNKFEVEKKLMYKRALERIESGEYAKELKEDMESVREFIKFLRKKRRFNTKKLNNRIG